MKSLALLLCILFTNTALAQSFTDYRTSLVKVEGYSLTPYANNTHVGIGHLLKPGERHGGYTALAVETLFISDLAYAIQSCNLAFDHFDRLPKDVKVVLVGLSFSVGRTGLMRFRHLRLAIDHRAYSSAAVELADSRWFHQVGRERAMGAYTVLLNQP